MKLANDTLNKSPSPQDKERRKPTKVFFKTNTIINGKHFKPFGCQVYVIDIVLQQNKLYHKWKQRSYIDIYLGQSPQHGRNTALILSLTTGLTSPQFDVQYYEQFDNVKQINIISKW